MVSPLARTASTALFLHLKHLDAGEPSGVRSEAWATTTASAEAKAALQEGRQQAHRRRGSPTGLGRPLDTLLASGRTARTGYQISVCSEISKASSTSIPRYLTVDSSLEWPSSNCTARRFFVSV